MVFVLSTICTFSAIFPILIVIIAGIVSITLVIALTMATASSRTVAPLTSSILMSIFGVCTTASSTTCTAPAAMPPIWWFPWWVAPSQGVGAFPSKVALSGTFKTSEGGRGEAPLIGTVPCSVSPSTACQTRATCWCNIYLWGYSVVTAPLPPYYLIDYGSFRECLRLDGSGLVLENNLSGRHAAYSKCPSGTLDM